MEGSFGRSVHCADLASAVIDVEEAQDTFLAAAIFGKDKRWKHINPKLDHEEDEEQESHKNLMGLHTQSMNSIREHAGEILSTEVEGAQILPKDNETDNSAYH